MQSNSLPPLNLPKEWIQQQLKQFSAPFYIDEIDLRLFCPKKGVCWYIYPESGPYIIGKGNQTIHTFAKEFFTGKIAAHGLTEIYTPVGLELSESEIECLNKVKGEKGVIQNLGHYYHRSARGYLKRGMITEYYPRKHIEMSKVKHRKTLSLKLIDVVRRVGEKGVIHRDIKLKNFLLDQEGDPVLADFGFACTVSSPLKKRFLGSVAYLAPELLIYFFSGTFNFTAKSDVWAVSVCVYQIMFERFPSYLQAVDSNESAFEYLKKNSYVVISMLKNMESISQEIKTETVVHAMLKKMFDFSVYSRPTLTELFPFDYQKEEVKPLDNPQQIVIIQPGLMVDRNRRIRPSMLL